MVAEQPAAIALVSLYEMELAAALSATQRIDSEALHDYRVALRRLFVLLKQFAQPDEHRRDVLHRIKVLMTKSNRGRDAQVMLAWLDREWPRLDEREQAGARQWRRSLKGMKGGRLLKPKQIASALKALVPPILKLSPLEGKGQMPLGTLVAQGLEQQAGELESLIKSENAVDRLHFIRLKSKTVRYLLLPFCDELPACLRAQETMEQLQAHLGDWHDAVLRQQSLIPLLRKEVVKITSESEVKEVVGGVGQASVLPGMIALARFNNQEQERRVALIKRKYLRDGGMHLTGLLKEAVAEMRRAAPARPDRLP